MKTKKPKRSWKAWAVIYPDPKIAYFYSSKLEINEYLMKAIKRKELELKRVTVTED